MRFFIFVSLIAASSTQLISTDGKRRAVVTDHAIIRGEKLEIGQNGNGSCKYTGSWKITPAWMFKNKEATYAVSAGENMYPSFMNEQSSIQLKKSWEMKYYLEIDTDNTSLAGQYNCQYSDKAEEIVHNVVVLGDLECTQNKIAFVAGRDKLDVNCSIPIWGAPGHSLPTLKWFQTQSRENSLKNASWVEEGKKPKQLTEEITQNATLQENVNEKHKYTRRIFRHVTKEDHGKAFHCNMTGIKGWRPDASFPTCGSDFPVIIVHSAPEFTQGLENLTAKHFQEDLLNLTCGAVGNPRPILKWLINNSTDSRVTPSAVKTMISKWDIASSLLFRVKDGDVNVSCVASNNVSVATSTTPLVVLPPPIITGVTFDPNPVKEGETIFVNCSSYPPDHVETRLIWTDTKGEIENSTFIANKKHNNRTVLCTALLKSKHGERRNTSMTSPLALNVTYGPNLSCGDVRHAPGTDGDHEMTCFLDSNPPLQRSHVRWTLEDGTVIENDDNFTINTTEHLLKVSSKITVKHEYILAKKKLDLIFGLSDKSKVLQVIVHYEQFLNVSSASAVTSGIVIGVVVIVLLISVVGSGVKSGVCRKTQLNSIGCKDVAIVESGRRKLENESDASATPPKDNYLIRGIRSLGPRKSSITDTIQRVTATVQPELRRTDEPNCA